jgi:hypothetical protein
MDTARTSHSLPRGRARRPEYFLTLTPLSATSLGGESQNSSASAQEFKTNFQNMEE